MALKCKILYWDHEFRVHGVVATRTRNGELQILAEAQGDVKTPFPTQLREVFSALKFTQADAVLFGGFVPEFVCFDLVMPNLDRAKLANALKLELSRRIPAIAEGMNVSFRVMPHAADVRQLAVRVFAIRSRVADDLWEQIRESGICIDAFCHPFMAAELSERIPRVSFPLTAPGLVLVSSPEGSSELHWDGAPDATKDRTGEALAAYALGGEFASDKKYLSDLPDDLRIRRFKKSRNFAILLFFTVLLAGGALLFRQWQNQDRQIRAYRRETQLLDSRLKVHEKRIEETKNLGLFAEKMLEALEDDSMLPVLTQLSEKLPGTVWVTSFRASGGKIALTLSVTGDSSSLGNVLNELEGWTVENQRQQQEAGNETWYVTLKRISS